VEETIIPETEMMDSQTESSSEETPVSMIFDLLNFKVANAMDEETVTETVSETTSTETSTSETTISTETPTSTQSTTET
jgi:hypothetical protein